MDPLPGLPTKTEQSDLFLSLYGRHGEAPMCVIAISAPNTAFEMAFEACRIAVKYMTPVTLLSDGFINNSSEPWRIPDATALADIPVKFADESDKTNGEFMPYPQRRFHARHAPGHFLALPGLTHRIGGIEKQDKTGNVSYDPENHHLMSELRQKENRRYRKRNPPLEGGGRQAR